ncbi:MAG: hypothetical protein ACRDJM_06885 [Actinomycetota bacterium]
MSKRSPAERKRLLRIGAIAILALFTWSFIASPNTAPTTAAGDETQIVEPATLSAYNAIADAAPVRGLIQHNTYLVSAEPAVARSTSEVSLPSQATSTSWLIDMGTVNGLHGTTTGNKVPTETTATQPGGATEEEYSIQRGFVGNEALLRFGAGVVRSAAERSERPRGFGYGYLGNLALLPAPGSPEAPPGSYDPEADRARETERPPSPGANDPAAYTPNPKGQMAILAIGSVASTSETFREEDTAISIAVAELNGINIGNRTADGRCTNCITIDSLRVETRAETNGTKEGSKASWRILLHRACRVAITNDPVTGAAYEGVQCLNPNPDGIVEAFEEQNPDAGEEALADPNARGVREVKTLDQLNDALATLGQTLQVGDIGLTLRVGTEAENKALIEESNPKGTVTATANARGLMLELRTTAASNALTQAAGNTGVQTLVQTLDGACAAVAEGTNDVPPPPPPANAVAVPAACATGAMQTGQAVRVLRLGLGQVKAAAKAVLGIGPGAGDPGDGEDTPEFPTIEIPTFEIPSFEFPSGGAGGNTYIVEGGLRSGPLSLKIDWASLRIEPWRPKDLAKGFFVGGVVAGMIMLMRRRLRMA